MKSEHLNVLVVSGGSFQGLTLIKGLRYSDSVRIIMADSSSENVGKYFVDIFYVVPEVSKKKQFLNALLKICKKEHINLIIPSTDIELPVLAESLTLFEEKNIFVAVSTKDFLTCTRNKLSLYRFLVEENFPALPLLNIKDNALKFPIIGKRLEGWGSRGILILNSYEEMSKHNLSELTLNYIWQPYLKDIDEYSIDCAINFDGTISEFVIRQRLKTIGGFAVVAENVHNSAIGKMIKDFLNIIKLKGARGIFNIQILKHGSRYFFSDINPRIGTSALFSYKLGINFPLFLCSYINPEAYSLHSHIQKSKKVKMVRYLEEFWIEKIDFNGINAFVFDLDDTLINQKLWISDKIEILWSKFSHVLPERKEFLLKALQIIEEGNRGKLFDALSQEFSLSDHFKEELINTYRRIEPYNCPLFPDVLETLQKLRQMGFKLALLSDNPPQSQRQKVKVCNLEKLFDVIVYSRELGEEKPSDSVFKMVAKLLKTPAKSLAMVGDNLYRDIGGALDSGYGIAFWLCRRGTFFNFEEELFNKFSEDKYKFFKIQNLKDLLMNFK